MHSIKTAVVVSILLVVGYAVYTTLNNERTVSPPSPSGDDWPNAAKSDPARRPADGAPGPARPGDRAASPSRLASDARPSWDPGAAKGPGGVRPGDPPVVGAVADARNAPPARALDPRGVDPAAAKSARPTAVGQLPDGPDANRPAQEAVRPLFRDMITAARREIAQGGVALVKVLRDLTPMYGKADFSAEESRQLTELLGQLAGEVIYSRKHYLYDPYPVQPGDTLQQIAQQCRVPWQLLAKINGIREPDRLTPGTKLKLVHGPFDALILLDRYELVLQVEGLYAGRFPIGIGRDQPQRDGDFRVREKTVQPTDANNPLGKFWIGLDQRLGIHGTTDIRDLRRADGRGFDLPGRPRPRRCLQHSLGRVAVVPGLEGRHSPIARCPGGRG